MDPAPTLVGLLEGLGAQDEDALHEAFTTWTEGQGISMYPAQQEALLELVTRQADGNLVPARGALTAPRGRDELLDEVRALVAERPRD